MNHVSRASYRIIRACLHKTGATHVETLSQLGSRHTSELKMIANMGGPAELHQQGLALVGTVRGVRHMLHESANLDLVLRGWYSSRRCL